ENVIKKLNEYFMMHTDQIRLIIKSGIGDVIKNSSEITNKAFGITLNEYEGTMLITNTWCLYPNDYIWPFNNDARDREVLIPLPKLDVLIQRENSLQYENLSNKMINWRQNVIT